MIKKNVDVRYLIVGDYAVAFDGYPIEENATLDCHATNAAEAGTNGSRTACLHSHSRSIYAFASPLETIMNGDVPGVPAWTLGKNHSAQRWQSRMRQRGWTPAQITEAIQSGDLFPAPNLVNPTHSAIRYVHPTTGRSGVVDDVTSEVIHVCGDGFLYE
jgi:hypothetical protein